LQAFLLPHKIFTEHIYSSTKQVILIRNILLNLQYYLQKTLCLSSFAVNLLQMQESLPLQQLSDTFRKDSKPRHTWHIGTEHEKFGFHRDSLKPLSMTRMPKHSGILKSWQ